MTDSNSEIITSEEVLVEGAHQQFGGADGDRIAHCQYELYASLHETTAQAGFAGTNLLARLASIQDSYWDVVFDKQISQF